MKKWLIPVVKRIKSACQRLLLKWEPETSQDLPYSSLSPIDNVDIENDYKESLDWALRNRSILDIKNIALTGQYGAGKSSIIKTYIRKQDDPTLKFLNISLATFKEEIEGTSKSVPAETLRLVELSILQQIFYRENDNAIPDSRFRKIKTFSRENLITTSLVILLLIVSVIMLTNPGIISKVLKTSIGEKTSTILHFVSLAVVLISSYALIYKSIRIINSVKISKFNISNAEIEVGENVNKSILNHHIDEILYFFEVTKYNVVVIEDLDRFQQTEIFTKLREINLLINNSKRVKNSVVFIYAVRDEMFKENDRTKFFDFIIPVIPVINQSNSSQKLLEKQKKYSYDFSEDLLESISIFIDDMRLLHNIWNEFYLYDKKLNRKLSHDRLLAIIVYKNLFPLDFTQLYNNCGTLYGVISNKKLYIDERIKEINKQIDQYKTEIGRLEEIYLTKESELRTIYIFAYTANLNEFRTFSIQGNDVKINDMLEDSNFSALITGKCQYRRYGGYGYSEQMPISLKEIERFVNPNRSFEQRLNDIRSINSSKINEFKHQIQLLERSKLSVRNQMLKEILAKTEIKIDVGDSKQRNLILAMLLNGYIDENYADYVSLFYEGSLTKADYQFLINVKSRIFTELSYKLTNINKLLSKINKADFESEFTFNFSLIDYLVNNPGFDDILEVIFRRLSDESDVSFAFVDQLIDSEYGISKFIKGIFHNWRNLWKYIEEKSTLTDERKQLYFRLIIEHANVDDIDLASSYFPFRSRIQGSSDFLTLIDNTAKTMKIVEKLEAKFINLDLSALNEELTGFIITGSFYDLNTENLRQVLSTESDFDYSKFTQKNYSTVLSSENDKVIEFISANLDQYIVSIYLNIPTNTAEPEEIYINLLNNDDIQRVNKMKLVSFIQTEVTDLSRVIDDEVANQLIFKCRVSSTWENVLNAFERNNNTINDSLISYLNKNDVYTKLGKQRAPNQGDKIQLYQELYLSLIKNENIENIAYREILRGLPFFYENLDISTLSIEKCISLIESDVISLAKSNYDSLKNKTPPLHIKLIEKNKAGFFTSMSDYVLDHEDVYLVLISDKFTIEEKNVVVENVSESILLLNDKSLERIGLLILKKSSFRVKDEIVRRILVTDNLTIEQKIRIHNWKHNQIEISYYDIFLATFEEPYSDLTIKGKKPLLENTEYNRKFIDLLEAKSYISSHSVEAKGIRVFTFKSTSDKNDMGE